MNFRITSICKFAWNAQSDRRGVVLIVVAVLIVMVALAGFGFLAEMTTEYEASRINGDLLQAQQTMASAETFVLSLAEKFAVSAEDPQLLSDQPMLFQSRIVSPVSNDGESISALPDSIGASDDWRFAVVNPLPERSSESSISDTDRESMFGELTDSTIQFGLLDESAKLHLATVLSWDSESPGRGREALMYLPRMTEVAADSILDWIDADNEPREFGAESEEYQNSDPPYHPRNSLPQSLEELLFVKGVDRDMFYGIGNLLGEVDGNQFHPWETYLTIHSAEENVDPQGTYRINLNEATPETEAELESKLVQIFPGELVDFLRFARRYGLSYSRINAQALESSLIPSQNSVFYEVSHLAELIDASVQLPKSEGGHLVMSPLNSNEPESLQLFRLLEENVTTSPFTVIHGRINLNVASEPVLLTILKDPAVVSQVVQRRSTLEWSERKSAIWLLEQKIVEVSVFQEIYPQITTQGHVLTGEIIVYRKVGGPFLRRKVTVSAVNQFARRVDWLDLTEHGLPVSLTNLEPIADLNSGL